MLLAGPRSFCAGVERAIEIVERALEMRGAPVYVRKQIVHNTRVVSDLEQRGAIFVDELDEVPDGATVVFSAHGVSPAVRDDASGRGLSVIDATCPLVSKVHAEARRFAKEGYTVALIGHAGHEEVEGTLGEAPDSTVLVQTAEDVATLDWTTRPRSPTSCRPRSRSTRRPTWRARCATSSRRCARPARTTSATRRPTGRPPSAPSPPRPTSCSSPDRRTPPTRSGWSSAPRGRARPAHLIDGATDIDLSWLARRLGGRPHGRRLGPARGGQRDHRGAVRPGHGHGHGTGHHDGVGPVRPPARGPPLGHPSRSGATGNDGRG